MRIVNKYAKLTDIWDLPTMSNPTKLLLSCFELSWVELRWVLTIFLYSLSSTNLYLFSCYFYMHLDCASMYDPRTCSTPNCIGFFKKSTISILDCQEDEKSYKTKWGMYCWTPCMYLRESLLMQFMSWDVCFIFPRKGDSDIRSSKITKGFSKY